MNRIILVLSIIVLGAACGEHSTTAHAASAAPAKTGQTLVLPPDSPLLQQIRRAPVQTADLPTDEIVAPGKIDTNPNRLSKIVLPVTGRIDEVFVKVGDAVHKDQPLLSLQSPDGDAAVSAYLSAGAAVTQAEAALAKAQADRDRTADLFEHDAIARKELLAAETALAQALGGREQAAATREQADRHLAVPGEFRSDTNTVLMTIADLSTVWVTSQVPESYIRFVQTDERVEISLIAYPGETFEGRVSRLADTVDPQTRTVKVQAEMDNRAGRFRPEMYGSIHHVESTALLPVVPVGAVIQSRGSPVVFVETTDGRFDRREVSLGKRVGDRVRVLAGVKAGDSIVVDGGMLLAGMFDKS